MNTIDEILATGLYTDRRGRHWSLVPGTNYWGRLVLPRLFAPSSPAYGPDDMRLMIERDMHRDACQGLHLCKVHPVPRVHFNLHTRAPMVIDGSEYVFPPGGYADHAEAMDAARALAVNS